MKKLYTTLFTAFFIATAWGQSFSMDDLVHLTSANAGQFSSYVYKKGYRAPSPDAEGLAYIYVDKKAKEEQPGKQIVKQAGEDKATVAYQTTVQEEFDRLCRQLQQEGYSFSHRNGAPFYQKGSITITTSSRMEGNSAVYSFVVEKKTLPAATELHFAEDLLQLTSHEYLAAVFGPANVRKDLFYFSEDEVSPCTVLFPNTGRQAIFIWKDGESKKDLHFLLIGGQLRTESTVSFHKPVELNHWRSRQGIRPGLSLRDLQELNGQPFTLHGWDSEQPGVVVEGGKGNIDFRKIGVVLNCLDCNEDRYYTGSSLISSATLLAQGRRVYVNTLVVLPAKQ